MKKLWALAVAAFIAGTAFISCGSGATGMKTDEDSMSYAQGVYFGTQMMNDKAIVVEKFIAGIRDAYGDKAKFEQEELIEIINDYYTNKVPQKNLKESEEYLAKIEKENPNVQKTESGLLYEIVVAGDPDVKITEDNQQAMFVYHGELKDGTVFDSSRERGDTVTFELGRLIPGWVEGMKLIGKGGKIKLWVDPLLGYADNPQGPGGPWQALYFEVDLIDVLPAVEYE